MYTEEFQKDFKASINVRLFVCQGLILMFNIVQEFDVCTNAQSFRPNGLCCQRMKTR